VVVNVQRCGPSTGLPTMVGQADMMQARWGSHGDYEIIALSPNSPQEMFDLTVEAFNLSERFRTPVLLMADETVGHMTERVTIPAPESLKVVARPRPAEGSNRYPYTFEPGQVAPTPALGEGACVHVTGLTHNERGYPAGDVETQRKLMQHLVQKIRSHRDDLTRVERLHLDDAEVAVVAYGITSRVARHAMGLAREKGIKAGLLRLQVVWPFPEHVIEELAGQVGAIVVPEINMGQIVREVRQAAQGKCQVISLPHTGGAIHTPEQILQVIEQAAAAKAKA
jgi:2-oxoglutarate ferredoxin oxidoreductase subunit alpha